MELKYIFKQIHSYIESKREGKRINQKNMAKELGISYRTYSEYYRGSSQTLAIKVLLKMLNKLKDDEILFIVRMAEERDEIENKQVKLSHKNNIS